ncbi:CheR family methyltransferase [Mucilaginibacter sp.]|uniref:CheR family methyltransferase n=1 Tax=Mucilaginibacter sp. TaxID=1882438 RepID=UPI003263D679
MAKISDQQYIIAIGASAGGLDAIAAFFDHTPLDAVSYILIQHLATDFKSQMAAILTRHTKLQVIEVVNDIVIESNKVYLIPSSNFMAIKAGKLILSAKTKEPRPYMTIDHFFISLANEIGSKAIGVVLSGTGKDGSKGVIAIKEQGGMVIVQDPKTASFSEMPFSAIETDCADFILSPEAMPQVIEDFVKNNKLDLLPDQKPEDLSDVELAGIINLIKGNMPLDFTDYKRPTILRRIKRRMLQHNFSRVDKYYIFLQNNPREIELLANDFLISVTSFFRDQEAFEIVEKTIIPGVIDNKVPGDILKIWVAGCATGEEAYSLAILVKEYLNKTAKKIEVKIFATDLNKAALDVGSRGVYAQQIEKTVSVERLEKFFTRCDDSSYKIKHEIRKMLIFAQHDLVKNPPYCNMDLISCRNLLIYLNTVLQKKVFGMMHFGLKKDGYLFLGPSENAGILQEDFKEISNKWNILQSKKIGRGIRFDPFSSPVLEELKTTIMEVSRTAPVVNAKLAIADEINLAIIRDARINGVCTDEHLTVIRSFGNPAPFLKKEIFNFNLYELLPDNTAVIFKAAARQAISLNKQVIIKALQFADHSGKAMLVDITITPVTLKTGEINLLIFFSGSKQKTKRTLTIKDTDIDQLTRDHLTALEKELTETKHSLQVAHDRIASSNENMQSFNEELQSANEEMQSANEEMQSTNEELQTINKEHQLTIDELTDLNDDLNNYFRSNTNGQLFVDKDLLLKKYSPAAVKHINIRDSDIGRPLSNITTNINLGEWIDDIKKVIAGGETFTMEAASVDHKTYQVMIMPYLKKGSEKPDGAIISFYDISELKELLKNLDISNTNFDASNQSLTRINADLNNFVYGASHDLNVPILNIEMVLNILHKKLDPNDKDVLKLAAIMNTAVTNFKTVISDLGKIGMMDAEIAQDSRQENFVEIYGNILDTLDERIKKSNAILSTDFREKEIRFSRKYLRSILLNLLTNALKFSSPGRQPEVSIKTENVDGFILLTVKDNGIGVAKDRIDFIFKMYQRINEDMEGQGVGLYLVKKIIDASGGKIEVESQAGKGSTFKIYFKR